MIDKILFGDNQFFGVNHFSEQTAIKQSQRFSTTDDIYNLLEYVNEIGIKSFMFTTHDQLEPVLKRIKNNPKFDDFKLIPCMPYAHKYANAMVEMGIFDTIKKFVPGSKLMAGLKGVSSFIQSDPVPIMKLLVDSEMKLLKGMNVQGIFLLNIVTDLLIGLGMKDILKSFSDYVESKYNVRAGFFTMNYAKLHDILVNELKMPNPLICSNVNKIGFRMNPNQKAVENKINEKSSVNIAMSILASGAIRPKDAVKYIGSLDGVNSVLFGASSPAHIKETKDFLETIF
jgi:hypothetical protein